MSAKPMASPQGAEERRWSASPWCPLTYADVVRSPDTYGVVILGDGHQVPVLVSHGAIREELWRFHRSPRVAASGVGFFRYIETLLQREAELLAVIVHEELSRSEGQSLAWMEFPAPPGLVAENPLEKGPAAR